MEELLTRYGIADILIFCAVLAAAVKGLITFWDWLWGRIKQVTDRDYAEENERKVLEKKVGSLEAFYAEREKVDRRFAEVDATFEEINQRIDTLIRSDREQIKAYITGKYHEFMDKGFVDDYSMQCLEEQYAIYVEEDGNSFIGTMMKELRSLPRKSKRRRKVWKT